MQIDMKRRIFMKGSLAAGTLGIAVGAGLLTPRAVLATWPEAAFKANKIDQALNHLHGGSVLIESADVKIEAPDIAENGADVLVTVTTGLADIESISIIAANNPTPLVASFNLGTGAQGFVSTRIKMCKSGDVIAVVKAGGRLHSARKEIKFAIEDCDG